MGARADRLNRVLLALLGLILLAGGAVGVLIGLGVFGQQAKSTSIVPPELSTFATSNGQWLWPAIAATTVVLALLGLRWLWQQLRSDRLGELEVSGDRTSGETVLSTRAIVEAVTEEVQDYVGVQGSSCRIIGKPSRPLVLLGLTLDARADLGAVRRRVETEAVPHLRQALDHPDLPIRVELTMSSRDVRHVA